MKQRLWLEAFKKKQRSLGKVEFILNEVNIEDSIYRAPIEIRHVNLFLPHQNDHEFEDAIKRYEGAWDAKTLVPFVILTSGLITFVTFRLYDLYSAKIGIIFAPTAEGKELLNEAFDMLFSYEIHNSPIDVIFSIAIGKDIFANFCFFFEYIA